MQKISFNINNGRTLEFFQRQHDGEVVIIRRDPNGEDECDSKRCESDYIPAGDMVMLANFYRYVKENDIQNDFINPHGKNND